MVRRSIVSSRAEGVSLIESGLVIVAGTVATKPSRLVSDAEPIDVRGPGPRFVGRGGLKLEHALETFGIDVEGRCVIDAGSSTGGFTDCLLQHGAARVAGFDVGFGQLHERLVADDRVVQRDRFNVRDLTAEDLPFPCSLLVADLSFISLTLVLPGLLRCVSPAAGHNSREAIVLVKPQFEVGRRAASEGRGVIRDEALHREACDRVSRTFDGAGWSLSGSVRSPITGADGNVEFLLWARGADRSEELGQDSPVVGRRE